MCNAYRLTRIKSIVYVECGNEGMYQCTRTDHEQLQTFILVQAHTNTSHVERIFGCHHVILILIAHCFCANQYNEWLCISNTHTDATHLANILLHKFATE